MMSVEEFDKNDNWSLNVQALIVMISDSDFNSWSTGSIFKQQTTSFYGL